MTQYRISKYYAPKGKGPAGLYLEGHENRVKVWGTDIPTGIGEGALIEMTVTRGDDYNGKPQFFGNNIKIVEPGFQPPPTGTGDANTQRWIRLQALSKVAVEALKPSQKVVTPNDVVGFALALEEGLKREIEGNPVGGLSLEQGVHQATQASAPPYDNNMPPPDAYEQTITDHTSLNDDVPF